MLPRLSLRSAGQGIDVWRPGLLLVMAAAVLSPSSQALWGNPRVVLVYVLALVAVVWGWVRGRRKDLQSERQISRQLREIDQLKDDFLTHISHDLRTPLFGMTGLAESLVDGGHQLDSETQTNLALIASSGRRLARLVDDIVDYSKLSHTSLKLIKRSVDLYPLADVVLTLSRHMANNKGIHLGRSIPRDLPRADADEYRLEQILYNLIGSAIGLTDSGDVQVVARAEADYLVMTISATRVDTSKPEFERTVKALTPDSEASEEPSTISAGLGLNITRQLIELHGGEISAAATAVGMSFTLTLPVFKESSEKARAWEPRTVDSQTMESRTVETPTLQPLRSPPSELPPIPSVEGANVEGANVEGARILIVDDDPVNRLILNNHLSRQHYDVQMVEGGPQALALMEEQEFDLLLLDIMMPRMSGYEVCRRLRERWSAQELPVIFLTAMNEVSDLVDGFSAGGNDYLSKPIAKGELLARVHSHLETLEAHRNLERLVEQRLAQLKVLSGLLPICSQCKKIRDDEGYWSQLETYIDAHSEAQFSHGICPECVEDLYSDFTGD